jgi:hypothetical protein
VCAKSLLDLGAEQRGNLSASARSKVERNARTEQRAIWPNEDPHEQRHLGNVSG